MAEPIEESSLYSDAPRFSFGVQFNVGYFLKNKCVIFDKR